MIFDDLKTRIRNLEYECQSLQKKYWELAIDFNLLLDYLKVIVSEVKPARRIVKQKDFE